MKILAAQNAANVDADTFVVPFFSETPPSSKVADGAVSELVDSGEAKSDFKKISLARSGGSRYLVVGLGDRDDFDPEKARVAAAVVFRAASDLGTENLAWLLGDLFDGAQVEAGFASAARNIPNTDVLPVQGINVYDILRRKTLVLTKAALEALEARFK